MIENILFIGGFPKSGTTLLQSLLDWHNEIIVFPEELKFYSHFYSKKENEKREQILKKTAGILRKKVIDTRFQKIHSGFRDYSKLNTERYFNNLKKMVYKSNNNIEYINSIFKAYLIELTEKGFNPKNVKYYCEKTPGNELYIDNLKKDFPKMKFIYIVRDPRDNYFTYMNRSDFSLEEYCYHWKRSFSVAIDNIENNFFYLLRYEDLIKEPKVNLQKIINWLNVDWQDSLLTPTKAGGFWSGNSSFDENTPERVNSFALKKRWKSLSNKKIKRIESYLFNEFIFLNYDFEFSKNYISNPMDNYYYRGFSNKIKKIKSLWKS